MTTRNRTKPAETGRKKLQRPAQETGTAVPKAPGARESLRKILASGRQAYTELVSELAEQDEAAAPASGAREIPQSGCSIRRPAPGVDEYDGRSREQVEGKRSTDIGKLK